MANLTTRAGKGAALTHQEVDDNFTGLNTELGQKEVAANKGVANGYASLDASGRVPSGQLPSYVDDVLEFANLAAFPAAGETGKIYVALDTNKVHRWSGSAYVEISASPGSTDSVAEGTTNLYFTQARARASVSASGSLSYNSGTGVFSYTQPTNVSTFTNDAGYITSSASITGNAETATRLQTGRTIAVTGDVTGTSVAFDGSANLSFATTLANSGVTAGTYGSSSAVPVVTVDAKGRVTGVSTSAISGSLTFTGDVTGSGTTGGSTTLTLANSGVTAGSYGSASAIPVITVDAKGRLTGVSTSAVSIPSGSLTFTGDVTGSGATGSSTALTLANSGVAAGTYTKVTVDAKGRVTTGASLASGDLPTYTGTITSSQVTTALGFTPYNSTNPAGYITSASLSSYLPLSGGTVTGTLGTSHSTQATLYLGGISESWGGIAYPTLYSSNVARWVMHINPHISYVQNGTNGYTGSMTGATLRLASNTSAANYWDVGVGTNSVGADKFSIGRGGSNYFNINSDGTVQAAGNTILHAGNYSSYALPLSGGTVSGATNFSSGITVNNASADGRGINLYSGSPTSPTYGLFFAQTGNFGTYGSVHADWATYFTMNSTLGRGWVFREVESLGNVAAISNQGNMTIRSHFEQGNNIARPNVSWSASSNSTGMVIFYLPGTTANYGMIHMVFDIYEYNGNAVSTVVVGGHNWSTSWYNVGANVIGQCGKEVRLGVKNGRFCVVFGTSGSVWEYGTIVLRKIHNGSFYDNIMNMVGDWESTQTTTESFTNITGDLRALRTPASFNAGGAITQAGNQVLHAGNYTSYAPSLTGSGASGTWGINITGSAGSAGNVGGYTSDGWLRKVGDSTQFQIYGNSRTIVFRTDGVTNPHGGGGYPYIWFYGGSGDSERRMILNTDGQLWCSNYGWLHDYFVKTTGGTTLSGTTTFNCTMLFPSGGGNGVTFGANHYSMGKDVANGSWSHPHYADLIIGYHTGIRIGAAYSGIRFYNNSPTTDANNDGNGDQGEALLMTIGGHAAGSGVIVNNSLTAYGSVSANDVYTTGGWFRNHTNNNGIYWSATGWHLYPASAGDFYVRSGTSSGSLLFLNSGGSGLGYLHCASDSAMGFLTSGGSWRFRVDNSGNARCYNNLYLDQNYGLGIVGVYDSTRYQGVFFMGDAYKMSADGTSLANMYGIGWSHPNAGGAAGNLTDHGMLIINNGSFRCAISNSIVASGNITAYSDERLKKNWRGMPDNFVERLSQVRVGRYERIDDGVQQVGVSAQSLQPLLPEAIQVSNDEMNTLSVSYGNAALAAAVELAKEVVMLKKEMEELKSRLH